MTDGKVILSLRVHDGAEKKDASLSSCWVKIQIDRADIGALTAETFAAKYIVPNLVELQNLRIAK